MLAVGGAIRQSLSRGVVRPSPCKPRRGGEALVSTRLMTLREVIYPPNDPPKRSPGLCPPNDSVRTLTVAEKPLPLESSRPGGGAPLVGSRRARPRPLPMLGGCARVGRRRAGALQVRRPRSGRCRRRQQPASREPRRAGLATAGGGGRAGGARS